MDDTPHSIPLHRTPKINPVGDGDSGVPGEEDRDALHNCALCEANFKLSKEAAKRFLEGMKGLHDTLLK